MSEEVPRIVPLPGAIITARHRMQATRVSTFYPAIRPPQRRRAIGDYS